MKNWILFPLLTLALSACATGANSLKMAVPADPSTPRAPEALHGTVWIESVGEGSNRGSIWTSQISQPSFQAALSDSLRNFGYLADDRPSASRLLTATIRAIDHPIFGLDMTVTTTVQYDLRGISEGASQTREIVARGKATLGEAFIGIERERIASERSAQDNIRQLLDWLATVK